MDCFTSSEIHRMLEKWRDVEIYLLWEMFVGAEEAFLHGLQTSKIPVIEAGSANSRL